MNLEKKYIGIDSNGDEISISLKELFSRWEKTLLYFYPKDNTPGCTTENKDFSDMLNDYENLGVQLVGVSRDTVDSHKNFCNKHNLKVMLLSDEDLELHKELGAYWEKNNYGKIVQGVIRSTFLFNKEWKLLSEWKNVRAKWHAERILKELEK